MAKINVSSFKQMFNNFIHTDSSTKIISIICAVIIWLAISISVYPTISDVIYNVPIEINTEGTFAAANSLRAELAEDLSADVYITGERSQVGSLDAADIILNVDMTRISAPGEYNLPLEAVNRSGKEFNVDKISPSSVMVKIERIVTKEFNVTAEMDPSISVADGYMTKAPIFVSANTISVTGPEEQVSSITNAVVSISSAEPITLSSSYEFTSSEITLYNNGVKISDADGSLTLSRSSFTVQIPVFIRQTLPLEVSVVNAPDGFDEDKFKKSLTLSASELDIAAPTDKIKDIKSINIGTIDMREVDDTGRTFTFAMENVLPEGYENLSGLGAVIVTCPSDGLIKKQIAIRAKNIQIINAPSQFDFQLTTSMIMPYFVGPANIVGSLTSNDITCRIDILSSDFDNTPGEYIMPVTFSVASSDSVWVNAGSSTLNIYVKAVPKEFDENEE